MKELPLIVAQTDVGKVVNVKIWRNNREVLKKIKLGRLETSEDFKAEKKEKKEIIKQTSIEGLKITVRQLTKKDVSLRKLPEGTTGVVITKIEKDSPSNSLNINDIIIEAQKNKIRTPGDLVIVVKKILKAKEKNILIVIYDNQNQRRYIGVNLN